MVLVRISDEIEFFSLLSLFKFISVVFEMKKYTFRYIEQTRQ